MKIKIIKHNVLADKEIQLLENEIGVSLPKDYKDFIRRYDGATPEENIFDEVLYISVDRFVPACELKDLASKIEGFPAHSLPVAEASGGNYIYLNPVTSNIYYWDHEIEGDDRLIADSFDKFISMIKPFDMESIKLKPGQVQSVCVDPSFNPEF